MLLVRMGIWPGKRGDFRTPTNFCYRRPLLARPQDIDRPEPWINFVDSSAVGRLLCAGAVVSWVATLVGMNSNARLAPSRAIYDQREIASALSRAEVEYQKGRFAKALGILDGLSVVDPENSIRRNEGDK